MNRRHSHQTQPTGSDPFDRIYRRYWPLTCAAAHEVLDNEADAEDAAQRVLLRVWRAGPTVWSRVCSAPYFRRAGCNEAKNVLRRRQQRAAVVPGPGDTARPKSESDAAEWQELRDAVRDEIDKLPNRCREVARLVYLNGSTTREAAEQAGITPKAVEKQRTRARRHLAATLARFRPVPPRSRSNGHEAMGG